MEDGKWLRLVTIGLVLAAIAVGYFLIAQRFTGTKTKVSESKSEMVATVPTPSVLGTDTGQDTKSAYQRIAERTRNGTQALPATGFPAVLIGILAASAAIAGFGLRKFPH